MYPYWLRLAKINQQSTGETMTKQATPTKAAKTTSKRVKSGILYEGPSKIDGAPIVVVAIGSSSNSKTGNMVQTYIIRADVDPITANREGLDYSICGDCPHRGKATQGKTSGLATGRSCYVNIGQGVSQVYKAYKQGKYKRLNVEEQQAIGYGRMVRLGTYGDPAMINTSVFDALLSGAVGHTGYTHQLGTVEGTDATRLMVSADSVEDASKAHALGYRTFRVIPITQANAPLLRNEILCPSYTKGVNCIDCKLCNGSASSAKSIAIVAHGAGKNNVIA